MHMAMRHRNIIKRLIDIVPSHCFPKVKEELQRAEGVSQVLLVISALFHIKCMLSLDIVRCV